MPRIPDDLIVPSAEVAEALASGRAVVALESTVISHGLPHPVNLETARAMEAAVRAAGAVPATIALIDGAIRVGLDEAAITRLATTTNVAKVSRRDIAAILAQGGLGATTVSATMIAAHLAGIRVFATGGIGGVHRGGETSLDISADLTELARTPVLVIASGAKSILDLPRTLEVLETEGVPVIGWRTRTLPAFHATDSGLPVPTSMDDTAAVARMAQLHWAMGLGGILLANPVPAEAAIPADRLAGWIDAALADAEGAGIRGKDVTPHLLSAIARASDGATLEANRALLIGNAALAGAVAMAIAKDKTA